MGLGCSSLHDGVGLARCEHRACWHVTDGRLHRPLGACPVIGDKKESARMLAHALLCGTAGQLSFRQAFLGQRPG